MYADDMLLCQEYAGPSLQTALCLIKRFGEFLGLQINWGKSQILPLDIGAPTVNHSSMLLVRASHIKYLGIQISHSLQDYIHVNRLSLDPFWVSWGT